MLVMIILDVVVKNRERSLELVFTVCVPESMIALRVGTEWCAATQTDARSL